MCRPGVRPLTEKLRRTLILLRISEQRHPGLATAAAATDAASKLGSRARSAARNALFPARL